jgi:hypothetical protein
LASAVPIHDEVTFEEIAKARGLYEPNVRRLLRHAINKCIFCEPRKGVVAHTATSKLLAEDEQLFDWVGATTDDLWQGTAQTINAMVKYPGSQEPQETVCSRELIFQPYMHAQHIVTGLCSGKWYRETCI